MKVTAIVCPKCKDIVYSRARHDCRGCSCGEVYVDGGRRYLRIGFKKKPPLTVTQNIKATAAKLFNDWDRGEDKFGLIKRKK